MGKSTVIQDSTTFIGSPKVRNRYDDISDVTLESWIRDPAIDFPAPLTVNGRRYWRVSDLEAWERRNIKPTIRKSTIKESA